jgi:hypothetical protein
MEEGEKIKPNKNDNIENKIKIFFLSFIRISSIIKIIIIWKRKLNFTWLSLDRTTKKDDKPRRETNMLTKEFIWNILTISFFRKLMSILIIEYIKKKIATGIKVFIRMATEGKDGIMFWVYVVTGIRKLNPRNSLASAADHKPKLHIR